MSAPRGGKDPEEFAGVVSPPAAPALREGYSSAAAASPQGDGATKPRSDSTEPRKAATSTSTSRDAARKVTSKDSYEFQKVLGYGSYSKVVLAVHKETKKRYAVKIVSKMQVLSEKSLLTCVKNERDILRRCNHPNIIKLIETFQSPDELFYVMENAGGGELLDYIKKVGKFDLETVRFITAEMVNGLEYLHAQGIVHRDLKPENLLLDSTNHIKFCDFGTAFLQTEENVNPPVMQIPHNSLSSSRVTGGNSIPVPAMHGEGVRGQTFCGTFQYISPELLDKGITTMASDLWAMGCIVFQMAAGHRPIDDGSVMQIFEKIRDAEHSIVYPRDFPPLVKELVQKLLVIDPSRRLGTKSQGGYPVLKAHPLFKGIRFSTLPEQKLEYRWRHSAPVWVSDESVKSCKGCNSEFTFTNRRHHCRKCGAIFCRSCSSRQATIPGLYKEEKVRVCNECYAILKKTTLPLCH